VLLQGKNAVIYGAGGSIGGAVARAFAREGATVHLSGRRAEPLETLAAGIRGNSGAATTAILDALDERAVDDHAARLVASAGTLDISVNVISHGELFGTPLAEMTLDDLRATDPYRHSLDLRHCPRCRAAHDQAALRRDTHLRRLRTAAARLLHRRLSGRAQRRRRVQTPARRRARTARDPRSHDSVT
jgi:NAD(P)-dependent dehydrogenase (short-subunit alcohol dehydrogenase family)